MTPERIKEVNANAKALELSAARLLESLRKLRKALEDRGM